MVTNDQEKQIKCSNNCISAVITDFEMGEKVCSGCGEIMDDCITDVTHDGRSFNAEDGMVDARTGPATSLAMYDHGLSTIMGDNRDSDGRMLPTGSKYKFNRLRIWDKRTKSHSMTSLSRAFMKMNTIMGKLGIPVNVMERAAYLYRKALTIGLTKGRTIHSLSTACMYIACRETGTPRTMEDMAVAANVEKKVLYRDMRTLITRLELSPCQYKISMFITKIANNLNLSECVKRDALKILRHSEDVMATVGKNPVAMAAAAIYLAGINNDIQLSQRTLSKHAGVSDVTIRNGVIIMRSNCKKNDGCVF